jgi:hypothetical protein
MALACFARVAMAQELRGTVRDSASGRPVTGAVIMTQDSRGATLARNLSGSRGGFILPLRPDARRVRVIRLGYRPHSIELPQPASGSQGLDVVLAALPTMLQGVRVSADGRAAPGGPEVVVPDARCEPRADREQALALLDQARAGLLSLVVAREANPARVTRVGVSRTLDATGTRILRQQVRPDSAADQTVSFTAVRSAAEFVRDGFRRIAGGQQTLFAPDADILLDDAFARGYCFHLAAPDVARPSEAGLAFSPASRRRGRVDIEGALWIDTVARALVNIAFHYRGVEEQAERMGAGGYIRFRDVPGGVTMIDRWWLRLVGGPAGPPQPEYERRAFSAQRTFEVSEIGGELARAEWRDGTSWSAPLGTLQLTLARANGTIAAGVGVALAGTGYRAISDPAGRVTFAGLVPGPYQVVVVDPLLVPIGVTLPTPLLFEARRATTDVRKLVVPTAESFLAESCGNSTRSRRSAWLAARVLNHDGTPANDARWRLRRQTPGGWTTVATGEGPGSTGLIQDCTSLEQRDRIELRAWRDGGAEARFVGELRDPVNVVPLAFPALVASRGSNGVPGLVELSGTVRDSLTGAPVANARVSVAGTLLEAVTDSAGRFLLAGIPRGEYALETSSPWLDSIGAVKRVTVSATGDVRSLALYMPTLSQIALATCGVAETSGVIVGRVAAGDGDVLGSAVHVVAEWRDDAPANAGERRAAAVRSLRVRTDARGTFRLCGVPAGRALTVRVEPDGAGAGATVPLVVTVDAARPFARADLVLNRDPDTVRLADLPAGTHGLVVRATGHAPWTARLAFVAGRTVHRRITLRRVEPTVSGRGSACTAPSHSGTPR